MHGCMRACVRACALVRALRAGIQVDAAALHALGISHIMEVDTYADEKGRALYDPSALVASLAAILRTHWGEPVDDDLREVRAHACVRVFHSGQGQSMQRWPWAAMQCSSRGLHVRERTQPTQLSRAMRLALAWRARVDVMVGGMRTGLDVLLAFLAAFFV